MSASEHLASPLESPSPPTSPEDDATSPLENPFIVGAPSQRPNARPTLASPVSPPRPGMTSSSTPLGSLNAARGPPTARTGASFMQNSDIAARMNAFSLSRAGPATPQPNRGGPFGGAVQSPGPSAGFPAGFKLPQMGRPAPHMGVSAPAVPGVGRGMSLAEKRGMKLPGGLPGQAPAGRPKPGLKLSQIGGGPAGGEGQGAPQKEQTQMERYADLIDTKAGALTFKGKAVVHGQGVDFATGKSFSISLDEVDRMDELGKGNYGTVYKVRHARPKFRKQGQGIAGISSNGPLFPGEKPFSPSSPTRLKTAAVETPTNATDALAYGRGGPTGIVMAMKEMRLELDDAKFNSIIMELDILHRCVSPYIVDFYGAFFQEGAVYICMEWMDGGSIDKIYGSGIPEGVLRKITYATVLGLKSLKEEHNIIHRDVKPTNILVNTRGQVKICDFGVSGNLVASIAKTNIGCQSYMAPERISSGGMAQAGGAAVGTYSVQSDIWSLGLTLIECAMGRYPYPPETYDNIFSQLSAIVDGQPPDLPADSFSPAARDFVAGCLNKIPKLRPTYPMLLQHAWLAVLDKPATITEEDEDEAEAKAAAEIREEATADVKDIEAALKADAIPTALPNASSTNAEDSSDGSFHDREVGEWVIGALERKRTGKMEKSVKPALHAAPLDATSSASSPAE